jgi:hypothetical protein
VIDPEDLPPQVISAAEVLAQVIEDSGILAGRIDPLPSLEQRARGIAYVATAMHHPDCLVTVAESDDG